MISIDTVAMLYYESLRSYKQSKGDYSMPKWCEASDIDKKDAMHTVHAIVVEKQDIKTKNELIEELQRDEEFLVNYGLAVGICNSMSEFVGVENV